MSLNIANYFQLRTKPCQINQKMATSKDGSKYLHILVEATKTCDKLAQISAILESMEDMDNVKKLTVEYENQKKETREAGRTET